MRARLLAFLRLRERPEPPPGSGGELETFRASPRFLYYSVLAWLPKQFAAAFGLLAYLTFFSSLERSFFQLVGWPRFVEWLESLGVEVGAWTADPTWIFTFFELLAAVAFVAQFLFTSVTLKLSWDLRWYMVGDEFLRIRHGLWRVREQTMTVARIQNMAIRQGPIQKLFGIADLEVHTAGGGARGGEEDGSGEKKDLHVGRFRGLEDAQGLRDRIRAQLIRHRGAGLGDADELNAGAADPRGEGELAAAARELLDEARALRHAFGESSLR